MAKRRDLLEPLRAFMTEEIWGQVREPATCLDDGKECLLTAYMLTYDYPDRNAVAIELRRRTGGSLVCWNDDPARTFADVRELLREPFYQPDKSVELPMEREQA